MTRLRRRWPVEESQLRDWLVAVAAVAVGAALGLAVLWL